MSVLPFLPSPFGGIPGVPGLLSQALGAARRAARGLLDDLDTDPPVRTDASAPSARPDSDREPAGALAAALPLLPPALLWPHDVPSRSTATGPNPIIPPVGPPGTSVDADIQAALQNRGVFGPSPYSLWWFGNQFRDDGPWDYKTRDRNRALYDAYGNFIYGATGRALGLSPEILFTEAGHRQDGNPPGRGVQSSRWKAWLGLDAGGVAPFGDDPNDHPWVTEGMRYFDEYQKRRNATPTY